ncbi:Cytochrome P450 78A5-like protein [Drosera capensis]
MSSIVEISSGFLPPITLSFPIFASVFILACTFAFILCPGGLAWALSKARLNSMNIPGPLGLPFLGLALDFTGPITHRVLAKLSKTFQSKPLMAFSIGLTRFIISSHPDTAKEILNSSAFADRPVKESAYGLLFHRAIGFAPFSEYWRNLRRISATHMFSPKRLASFGEFRRAIGLDMVKEIKGLMSRDGQVEVRKVLHFGSLNNVMMSVFGKRYEFGDHGEADELEGLVSEGYDLLGMFNYSDHFPLLGWLDLQGVRKRCNELVKRVNVFVGSIVDEHKYKRQNNSAIVSKVNLDDDSSKDFVHVLLDLEGENKLSDSDTIAVLWEMIFRGTDTVAILLEWILARMVLHPEIQAKAQAEIHNLVGKTKCLISDADLPSLPYLQAIIKETLRMHPPGPLLSWARLSIHDTQVDQHFIPAGTIAMVNMWAITHDEDVWADPDEFKPERFLEENVAIMGSDLRLAPFGSGRRVCPGKAMSMVTVQLWLAQMLQNFNWVSSSGKGVDLTECLKLSMEMKNPLICKAIPRTA